MATVADMPILRAPGIDTAGVPCRAEPGPLIAGRLKWFDTGKGYGFIVGEQGEGDILLRKAVLAPHGCAMLPEGTRVICSVVRQNRGLCVDRLLAFDLTTSRGIVSLAGAAKPFVDEAALEGVAQPFEPVSVGWFDARKGYGFLVRADHATVFVHIRTMRAGGLEFTHIGDAIQARVAEGSRGLVAVAVRRD